MKYVISLLFFLFPIFVQAQNALPELVITEINFRNQESDFIKIEVTSDADLGNYKFYDDKNFFIFPENFPATAGNQLIIEFKNATDEIRPKLIKLKKSGLTATTEQFIIKNSQDEIVDAICWENKTPTKSETAENEKLNIDCLDSTLIEYNESFIKEDGQWIIPREEVEEVETAEEEILPPPKPVTLQASYEGTTIQITEFLPNPEGRDTGNEWIELYNFGSEPINLAKWQLDDQEGQSSAQTIEQLEIQPRSYVLIKASANLNNSEDEVRLIDPNGTVVEVIFYEGAPSNESYALIGNEWQWTSELTPAAENIWTPKEGSPIPELFNGDLSDRIFITEIYPNPQKNEVEWIELFNASEKPVNLGGWFLDDIEGGSKPYLFSSEVIIEPHDFLTITKEETKLNLNNSDDSVRLFDFTEKIIDQIEYETSEKGLSYSLVKIEKEARWFWTEPTANEENPVFQKIEGEIEKFSEENFSIQQRVISFNSSKFTPEIMQTQFTVGTVVEVIIKGDELIDYKVLRAAPPVEEKSGTSDNKGLLPLSSILSGGAFLYREKIKLIIKALTS